MATVLEGCTTEVQHSDVRFLWGKGLNAKVIYKQIKKYRVENLTILNNALVIMKKGTTIAKFKVFFSAFAWTDSKKSMNNLSRGSLTEIRTGYFRHIILKRFRLVQYSCRQ
jgi:hypothetical protein